MSLKTALEMNHGPVLVNNNQNNLLNAEKMGQCSKLLKTYLLLRMCISTNVCLVQSQLAADGKGQFFTLVF